MILNVRLADLRSTPEPAEALAASNAGYKITLDSN
jgi:hypothetical protein